MKKILLIGSYQPEKVSNSEIHDRILERRPHLAKFDFTYLGIVNQENPQTWDFAKYLELIVTEFKPDYILVHTGLSFQDHPSMVVKALINVSQKLPNVIIGFQDGKDYATKTVLSGGRRWNDRYVADSNTLSTLESSPSFKETNELKEIITEVYSSSEQEAPNG
jgi:hypothetical protein